MTQDTNDAPDVLKFEGVGDLLARAQAGDQSVLPQLREFLDGRPDVWRQAGDLAAHVREALLTLAAGGDLLAREVIARRLGELRDELAGPAPSPLERLLVERVVLAWAMAHQADLDALQKSLSGSAPSIHAERRQDAAARRYLAAVRTLATVRKLLPPRAALRPARVG